MHTQKIIEQFGYKPNEAKVYLGVLNLGESTVSEIARHTNLPRTSVQFIVNKLHLDGLLNFYTKKRSKHWVAEKPEKFLLQLKEKEIAFESVISKLNTLKKQENHKPSIKIFNDLEEIKLIFQDILDTKNNISAIVPWVNLIKVFGEEYINDFIESRVAHFLKVRLLTVKIKETINLKKYDAKEMRYTCFLPQRCTITDAILIYAHKVAIISLHEKTQVGFLIEDENITHTMRVLFEELWDQNTE